VRVQLASGELAVSGDQWPLLVYEKGAYVPEEPWDGLFRNELLVWVSCTHLFLTCIYCLFRCEQAFKHIFTSPSSVEKEVKATRSGNARIHGMTRVTTASLAYIATQVRLLVTPFLHYAPDHMAAPLCTVFLLGLL
jgi:hypothetical protein